jgi:predicted nucleic acid-binding protein
VIVVDSSALVALLEGAPAADSLRPRLTGEELHAPALLDYEVTSAVRSMTFDGRLLEEEALAMLADLGDVPIVRWDPSYGLLQRAFLLRHTLSPHDASYVALAEALECPVVTCDARLARSHGHDAAIELH